jgi:hypothetical protein
VIETQSIAYELEQGFTIIEAMYARAIACLAAARLNFQQKTNGAVIQAPSIADELEQGFAVLEPMLAVTVSHVTAPSLNFQPKVNAETPFVWRPFLIVHGRSGNEGLICQLTA